MNRLSGAETRAIELEPELERMIGQYGDSLLRMCFLYLRDMRLAEDAVQDTFIKVYQHYVTFRGNSSEKTWIMRIAINVCKNYLRSSWWKRIDYTAALDQIPAAEAVQLEDDSLLVMIMSLPAKYREVILLYYYQELKIREIAVVLQLKESTVSVRLKRAREKLRIRWEGAEEHDES